MDDSHLIPDIWTRIIALAPLESVAAASRVCRYLRDLVARDCPTLGRVPRFWRKFATKTIARADTYYQNKEESQQAARFFVRELVRLGIHEVPGILVYTTLSFNFSKDFILGLSLRPSHVNRTMADGERRVNYAALLGLDLNITYRLYRARRHKYGPYTYDPIKYVKWTTAMGCSESPHIPPFVGPLPDALSHFRTLSDLLLDPPYAREWVTAKAWMADQLRNYPTDRPYKNLD